jgi:N,N'-diacetyllegionaminate synthase
VTMVASLNIGDCHVGRDQPCLIIAEAGVNHNGDLALARKLVDAAADAGADAVKFQTFSAERLVTPDAPQADYQRRNMGKVESQFDMLKRLELSEDAHRDLISYCQERNIVFLSTPFEAESADFLESLDVPGFKIPSGEITNLPFLSHVARKQRPIILSTGMSTLDEVREAVDCIRAAENDQLALLHCVSNYPAAPDDVNLRAMETMINTFDCLVGYSDHTEGIEIAFAAVALGACIIEKHFTLDRNLPGPDHKASLEPGELAAMVAGIRRVASALGDGVKQPTPSEAATAAVARKSIVAAHDIAVGTVLEEQMLAVRRPGSGISPSRWYDIIGCRTKVTLHAGERLFDGCIE